VAKRNKTYYMSDLRGPMMEVQPHLRKLDTLPWSLCRY